MSDLVILAQGVWKTYGEGAVQHHALRGVDVEIASGEFVALQGPSGCGKSTLLHIFGAMDRPTEGVVQLDGQSLGLMSLTELAETRRKRIGFVFQAFNLLPTLNVEENVRLPLLLDRRSDAEAAERAASSLSAVGLSERSKHRPSQLSGGEMQRVAVARALALEPRLIIADEPTGSLDSGNGRRVLELLSRLNSEQQITVLMATHSAEASSYASRILNLRDGQIDTETSSRDVSSTV